jgi:hypothetical protein
MGVPYEAELFTTQTVGREDGWKALGGFPKTIRLVTLLHETTHLVQDLTLGACLEQDRQFDEAGFQAFKTIWTLSQQEDVRCPLDRREWHAGEPGESSYRDATAAKERAEALIERPVIVEEVVDGLNVQDLPEELTGRMLIEGIASVRVASVLAGRCQNDDDAGYLRTARGVTPLLPEDLPPLYSQARELFATALPIGPDPVTAAADDAWPAGYRDSTRAYLDSGFSLLADIALHIPPSEVNKLRIEQGVNNPDDFSPAHRFLRAIKHVRESGGFPDATDPASGPDGFYRQVFDQIAGDPEHDWPTLEETDTAWLQLLLMLKQQRGSATDGYRIRLLLERRLHPALTSVQDPLVICLKQGVPVLHLTPTGLKVLQGTWTEAESKLIPHEFGQMSAVDFAMMPFTPWQDAPAAMTVAEALKDQEQKLPSLLQEIVFRSFFRALEPAILSENAFACPFAKRGCEAAQPCCNALHDLDVAPDDGCALRVYLPFQGFDASDLKWSGEE